MRWQKRSIPALPKTCNRKMPLKAALLKRTRAQRIPFRPGVRYSNGGRIHSRRPILSFSFFTCKNGGGPYITGSFGSRFHLGNLVGSQPHGDRFGTKAWLAFIT